MATRNVKKIAIKDKSGNLNSLDLTLYAKNVDASLTQKGLTTLQTVVDDTENKAATPKAVNSVKAIADANTSAITKLNGLVGDSDAHGTLFNDVAFTNKANTFTDEQTISNADKTLNLKIDPLKGSAITYDAKEDQEHSSLELTSVQGVNTNTLTIKADGSVLRGEMPVSPTDNEVASVGFVKKQTELLKDATDTQKGIVLLSDTIDEKDAATGKTAATPKAVKTVKDAVDGHSTQITQINSSVEELRKEVEVVKELEEASNKGQKTLAYKDYTQDLNQTDMKIGVYYMVPFNAQDQFVEFDPTTGRPKAQQADSVTDTNVKYCVIMYKGPSGTASNLGKQDQQMNFDLFAKLASNNTFTGDNTFNKAPTKVAQSANADLSDLADGVLVSKKEVTEFTNKKVQEAKDSSIQIVTQDPEVGSMTEGVIYFVVDSE